jgi:hypothetical protein
MDLFALGAPWAQGASHVSVFKLYAEGVLGDQFGRFSDTQLQEIFSFLKQHNIALALEWGLLIPSGGCGVGIEGFTASGVAQMVVDRITENGGTLNYLAMDEPFQHAHDVCNWTPQQVATNALTSLNVLKGGFPGLIIGDIEVVPDIFSASPDWLQQYSAWMDAFQEASGSRLAFFDCDTGFTSTWMNDVKAVRAETAARGIPLGVIYNGLQSDSSDTQWITHAQRLFTNFELSYGQPDQAIFQSWTAFPLHALPETMPYTFTWLIDQYTLPRPSGGTFRASDVRWRLRRWRRARRRGRRRVGLTFRAGRGGRFRGGRVGRNRVRGTCKASTRIGAGEWAGGEARR